MSAGSSRAGIPSTSSAVRNTRAQFLNIVSIKNSRKNTWESKSPKNFSSQWNIWGYLAVKSNPTYCFVLTDQLLRASYIQDKMYRLTEQTFYNNWFGKDLFVVKLSWFQSNHWLTPMMNWWLCNAVNICVISPDPEMVAIIQRWTKHLDQIAATGLWLVESDHVKTW